MPPVGLYMYLFVEYRFYGLCFHTVYSFYITGAVEIFDSIDFIINSKTDTYFDQGEMCCVLPSNLYTSSALNDSLRPTILQIQVSDVNYMKGTVICPL